MFGRSGIIIRLSWFGHHCFIRPPPFLWPFPVSDSVRPSPLPTPAAPATHYLANPAVPTVAYLVPTVVVVRPTIPAIVCLFQPIRLLFVWRSGRCSVGWRSDRSLAAPLFIVRPSPSPWSFFFVRSCPPAGSISLCRSLLYRLCLHLYVGCRLSSFLVICPVLSGRPPAVPLTLRPEASIGHSANYSSLFGAPFRPLVRSLVVSRLPLRLLLFGRQLLGRSGCCPTIPLAGCTVVVVRPAPLFGNRSSWPFRPLRLYFGHFGRCPSTPAVFWPIRFRPLQPSSSLTVRHRLRRPSSFWSGPK